MLITIIIPSYNSGAHIQKCLDSISHQDFNDYEILIIDGLSTDNTLNIIKPYSETDKRVLYISEKDNGIYDAMNKGIKLAKGEWIYFMGSDDELYDSTVLEDISIYLKSSCAELVYGDVQIIGNVVWATDNSVYDGKFDIEKLFKKNISHQSIFYNRTIFERLGEFNIKYSTCADWDFNHRCFANVKTEYINRTIAKFFAGGESTKNTLDDFMRLDCVTNLKRYYAISYFNKLFSSYSWPMWNVSNDLLAKKSYLNSIKFFVFACYHSDNKFGLFKNYLHNIVKGLNKKSRRLSIHSKIKS